MSAPGSTAADVLVIFGITGDLAKKMTFPSLYRLERRRMLHCPVIGVSRSEWSVATCWITRDALSASPAGRVRPE